MSAPPVRVAVVGCGGIGTRHFRAAATVPGVVPVAACDTDPVRAAALCRGGEARPYTDLDALLRETQPDVVTVATPDDAHVAPVLAALEAGCHVFCEKPIATDLEDARRMADAARASDRRLGIDYNRRFGFGYRTARAWVDAGRIGDVSHAWVRVTDGIVPAYRKGAFSILYTLLTHHVDLLRWFCGEVVSVHLRAHNLGPDGRLRDAVLSLAFDTGAIATVVAGLRDGQSRTRETMEIGGTRGAVRIDDVQQRASWHGLDPDLEEVRRPDYFAGGQSAFYDTLDAHLAAFLDAVRCGEPAPVSADDGVRGLEVVEAAIRSHRDGASVAL